MSNNQTLCDFAVTEMIHDYGLSIDGTDPGPQNINMISSKRYNDKTNNPIFNKILSSGLPNCSKFKKFDEPQILKYIAGAKIKEDIQNNSVNGKTIETINGNVYHVKIANKKDNQNIENGENFFEELEFGHFSGIESPVILADTFSWVYGMFKQGPNGNNRKIYIYSPLVVLADSASKANITNRKKMEPYFDNPDGVELINVVDEDPFKAPMFNLNSQIYAGFFSNFSINTYMNNKKIEQTWSNLQNQGRGITSVKRSPANELNNKSHTFKRITQWINSKPPQTEQKNKAALSNLGQNNPEAKKNSELFNVEIQSKRSGDWLPVIYILNYDDLNPTLYTYNDPDDVSELSKYEKNEFFRKDNMYILTVDTPLVAYSLYCGVNLLYITNDGKLVKFEADPENTFSL